MLKFCLLHHLYTTEYKSHYRFFFIWLSLQYYVIISLIMVGADGTTRRQENAIKTHFPKFIHLKTH